MHFADHLKSYVIVLWRNAGELDFKVIINGYFISYRLVFYKMGKKKMKKLSRATTYPAMKKRCDNHLLPKSGFKGQKESFEKLKLKNMPVK